jgi:hypothetical protein
MTEELPMPTTSTCPQPRILYSAIFAWLSIAGGRFIAPFLEHEAGFSDSLIDITVAMQLCLTTILGTLGGSWADGLERKYPNRGRSHVILAGVVGGSLFFLLHGTWRLFPGVAFFRSPSWHMTLPLLYAICVSMVNPVLDGLTIAHLEREPGREKSDYGKERLYGAIWWGVTNLAMGLCIDLFGYRAMYMFVIIATVATILLVRIYVRGNLRQAFHRAETRNIANNDLLETGTVSKEEEKYLSLWKLMPIMVGTVSAAAFIFSYFCLSSGFAVVENLVFLYFESLGGSNTLNGITVALTVMFEIPIFHLAPTLLKKYGPFVLLQIANAAYVIRVVGYTLIPQGKVYFVLLLEPLHGVIYGCSQTGAVDFVSQLMPLGYEASGQGLLFLFRGLGGITGLSLSGFIEKQMGARVMYRTFAAIVTGGAVLFGIASTYCGRPSRGELDPMMEPKAQSTEKEQESTRYGSIMSSNS